jgi:SAM-dependent methyltransferase
MTGTASASGMRTAEELSGRLFQAAIGTLDLIHVYIGDRLGLYRALADHEAATPGELAAQTGMDPRYAREWLEQQAVTGMLDVRNGSVQAEQRRYSLPPAYAETLLDEESLNYLGPIARSCVSAVQQLPGLLRAYRSGGGVPWESYGEDGWQAQAAMNRPLFVKVLGRQYLPEIKEIDRRLRKGGSRVADVACGAGWSSIGIAQAYPTTAVDGFDLDEQSIALGRRNAKEAGVADRVTFSVTNIIGNAAVRGRYDLVTVLEALHDMSRPVEMLHAMRDMLAPGGSVLVINERVAEHFTAPGDDIERFTYGWSLPVCLPTAMTEQPSAATGTVMRPDTLRGYAREAGFARVEVLPIQNDFFRFYRLIP